MLKRQRKRDCGCSGHPHGRPKITRGPCYGCGLRKAVKERILGKKLVQRWLRAKDRDDVED